MITANSIMLRVLDRVLDEGLDEGMDGRPHHVFGLLQANKKLSEIVITQFKLN